VIAKLSRREVALQFLNPAPEKLLTPLLSEGEITPEQAEMARFVPMADDITVEADSGGHTDNRPLTSLLPSLLTLRDEQMEKHQYPNQVRMGAAGGIGTPTSTLGAFTMGADYVVTGSINQGCLEANTSQRVKELLAEAASTDVMMAPAADMFEMGVNVQVLKRGTMFPMRAKKLYHIYENHQSMEEFSPETRKELENRIFQRDLGEIWEDCVSFFQERDPTQIERARHNPKRKMALIFRWYLGLATHWGIQGVPNRAFDYQIWCGPAMGAFNDWTHNTFLAEPARRNVVQVAEALLKGAAYQHRLYDLKLQGLTFPAQWSKRIT
jgi:PfaD family protein